MERSTDIRSSFLKFFAQYEHEIVPSAPLVPLSDHTLLFTNSGMVQFKEVFLGKHSPGYSRAASSQRCLRAGGKHNDLENVGYTARHHTFFEMLGNFSFGDYFKQEAIHYAWEYLTRVVQLPEDRLWVTVYSEDQEAADIWLKDIGVQAERFRSIDSEDNFWSMGDTGPCGPCTEVFYDYGESVPGGPPGTSGQEGDRYTEIWNLVFMQYERDKQGLLTNLPEPSVDTGMGLERLTAVLQGVTNNYDTDLFAGIISATADIAKVKDKTLPSLRVISDHIRACSFLISDGVMPANEGRGYVLRRIIRRAARHGYKLGIEGPFFHRLVQPLIECMGSTYPELVDASHNVKRVLENEEQRFSDTLVQGMRILQEDIEKLSGDTISGKTAFKLYDTYGFPCDLTADVAREHNLGVDLAGFDICMKEQQERGRQASRFDTDYDTVLSASTASTQFTGYDSMQHQAVVQEIFVGEKSAEVMSKGDTGGVILDKTPFYAESGGQVGDQGLLKSDQAMFRVFDTQKQGQVHVHFGSLESGCLRLADCVQAQVDSSRRQAITLNHSSTHLLHAALRTVLGQHVQQKGSLVAPDRLRFDFSHNSPVSKEELSQIENIVNFQVRLNSEATAKIMEKDQALKEGALALFGEKYESDVRVLSIGEFSTELCGGTHVSRSGDIGIFKIISESGIASGIRRIEAVTGDSAIERVQENEKEIADIASLLKVSRKKVVEKIEQILAQNRELEKDLDKLKNKVTSQAGSDLLDRAVELEGVKVLASVIEGADMKSLREMVDLLKDRLGSSVVVLGTSKESKVSLVAGVTTDLTGNIKANTLVNSVAVQVGGKGGGRDDMAQAGGNNPDALHEAIQSVPDWVRANLRQ